VDATIQAPEGYLDQAKLDGLFKEAGIANFQYETVLVVAYEFGEQEIVGALTTSLAGEWSLAVREGYRSQGLGTAMVRFAIQRGESGYLVAGTEGGLEFLLGLYHKLSSEEREHLDVPCWGAWESWGT
jgi:GNAT superfamily N-acetyltransferase